MERKNRSNLLILQFSFLVLTSFRLKIFDFCFVFLLFLIYQHLAFNVRNLMGKKCFFLSWGNSLFDFILKSTDLFNEISCVINLSIFVSFQFHLSTRVSTWGGEIRRSHGLGPGPQVQNSFFYFNCHSPIEWQ